MDTIARTFLPLALLFLAATAHAQDAATDFKQNCQSCHTIGGGRLTGPDLKNVSARKDRAWLVRFIVDPAGVLASGDPYARKLLEEANNVPMPNVAGMSKARAEALMDLIAEESTLEKSQFAGVQISERPLTAEDVAIGRAIFRGTQPLKNGGTACIHCHTVGGIGGLGGGHLGPDLTKVFEKYENRKRLGAWLSAPATENMLPTFRKHPLDGDTEILPLIAYLAETAKTQEEDDAPSALVFVLLGLGGAAGCLVAFGGIWKGRFRGARRPLVEAATR